jgi:hypothetical protein
MRRRRSHLGPLRDRVDRTGGSFERFGPRLRIGSGGPPPRKAPQWRSQESIGRRSLAGCLNPRRMSSVPAVCGDSLPGHRDPCRGGWSAALDGPPLPGSGATAQLYPPPDYSVAIAALRTRRSEMTSPGKGLNGPLFSRLSQTSQPLGHVTWQLTRAQRPTVHSGSFDCPPRRAGTRAGGLGGWW